MKTFVLVALVAFVGLTAAITEEQKQKVLEHRSVCGKESGAAENLLTDLRNGKIVDDPKLKVYIFCFGKRIDFVDEAGVYKKDVMKAKLTPEFGDKVEPLIEACTKGTYSNGIDSSYAFIKCFFEKAPQGSKLF